MSNQNLEAKHKRESNDSKEDQSQTLAAGPAPTSRRAFMGTVAAGVVALPPLLSSQGGEARAQEFEPQSASTGKKRAKQALNIRIDAADQQRAVPIPAHPDNGDEARYATKFANYSKGLKHDPSTGEVDLTAYNAFLTAINSGSNADFDSIVTKGLY
ncbi:MAG: twin-arginine translocation signal domain-containing protein, partial [Blastocatellia bacterium]